MNTTNHSSPSGEELKPCPFCGEKEPDLYFVTGTDFCWKVKCRECGASRVDASLGNGSQDMRCRDRVIEKWNRRAAASDKHIGEDAANGAIGEREAFEAWWNANQTWPVAAKNLAFLAWNSRAALTVEKVAAEPVACTTETDLAFIAKGFAANMFPLDSQVRGVVVELYSVPQQSSPSVGKETSERLLLNLLARIYRDGGHYVALHGIEKASLDAEMEVAKLLALKDDI